MSNSPSSASLRFNIFASLNSREKSQKQTKPQDHATMKANIATLTLCTASTLMDVDHKRIGRKIMGHHLSKQTTAPPPTRDLTSTTKGVDQQSGATVMIKAHTQSDLRTACTTVIRRTIAPKIVPSTISQKRKWINTYKKFRSNPHPGKLNHTMQWNPHHQQYSPS
jgi:hypothetical protein